MKEMEKIRTFRFAQEPCFPRFARKISWIQVGSKRDGGNIYGSEVREALSEDFNLELKKVKAKYFNWRYLKFLERFFNLIIVKGKSDLWIRDDFFSVVALSLDKTLGKKLALIYHLDFSVFPLVLRPIFFLLEKVFYFNLKKADAVVTISEYWKNHFLKQGFSNVSKIYCAFDLANFKIDKQEISEFKKKFGLERKPIIYIGNCQKAKGVVEAFKALKDLDVYLVTSGERKVKIPAINLNLKYRDYLRLLGACSIAITMSKFKEGWCRTAHEAMLLRTPVIGSGRGGMEELLKGAGQIICKDFNSLREEVECLLNHPEIRRKMGETGFNFAKNFTVKKFNEDWLELIKKLFNEKNRS